MEPLVSLHGRLRLEGESEGEAKEGFSVKVGFYP
jgi:hypothetical protein